MDAVYYSIIALIIGFVLDQLLGDPQYLPHPVVGFGKSIAFFEKSLNKGKYQLLKGAVISFFLVAVVFISVYYFIDYMYSLHTVAGIAVSSILIFFSLSAKTLRSEVIMVFRAVDVSVEDGRKQVARIVGRNTSNLSVQQIRTASLETLSENLSDGIIAPLFWMAMLGVPGMLMYKMINTLDSMIGYKNDRYHLFGKFAARLDDVANFIPARITAILILAVNGKTNLLNVVWCQAKNHSSPNSGYPEAALATVLQCRFGGPNYYFGKLVDKPFIGAHQRPLNTSDLNKSISSNQFSEIVMLAVSIIIILLIQFLFL